MCDAHRLNKNKLKALFEKNPFLNKEFPKEAKMVATMSAPKDAMKKGMKTMKAMKEAKAMKKVVGKFAKMNKNMHMAKLASLKKGMKAMKVMKELKAMKAMKKEKKGKKGKKKDDDDDEEDDDEVEDEYLNESSMTTMTKRLKGKKQTGLQEVEMTRKVLWLQTSDFLIKNSHTKHPHIKYNNKSQYT